VVGGLPWKRFDPDPRSVVFPEGIFFNNAAIVTFGGGYAVPSYVAQEAMFHYWLARPNSEKVRG
jgi:chromate transporter